MCPQGNCAISCCTISSSGQASAKGAHVLEASCAESLDPRELCLEIVAPDDQSPRAPQPWAPCLGRMSVHRWTKYNSTSSRLTAIAARVCDGMIRALRSLKQLGVAVRNSLEGGRHREAGLRRFCAKATTIVARKSAYHARYLRQLALSWVI